MLLSVIIVSFNVRYFVRQCLDSLFRSAEAAALDLEVFVVDNDSKDDTVAYLQNAFAKHIVRASHEEAATSAQAAVDSPQASDSSSKVRLHLIANRHNVGFGRANNQALRQAKGDFVLFLNPDTILTEQTLTDCLHIAEQHLHFGAIGVKMLNSDGTFAPESRRGLPTPWVAFCKMVGLAKIFPQSRRFARYYMSYLSPDEVAAIDVVSGAFMFCSRKALNEVGGFDEAFFMYGEDIDLSYRFLKAGFQNYYVPTPILHYKGESTHKNSYRYVHVFYEAMLIFFQKHFPTSSFALRIPVHCAIYARALLALLGQSVKNWSRFLTPKQRNVTLQLRIDASSALSHQWQERADVWDFKCLSPEENPKNYGYCGYSPEEMPYSEILARLQTNDRNMYLATYFPSWDVMITGKEVFE